VGKPDPAAAGQLLEEWLTSRKEIEGQRGFCAAMLERAAI
jgi:hypothetical protein